MNRWEGTGGFTRDPEFTFIGEYATPWWRGTIAVNDTAYDGRERKQIVVTTYLLLSARGDLAERLAELGLGKGDEVLVVGQIRQHPAKDGDGEAKTHIQVVTLTPVRRSKAAKSQHHAPPETAPPIDEPPF